LSALCQRKGHTDLLCIVSILVVCGGRGGVGTCFALFTSYPGIAVHPVVAHPPGGPQRVKQILLRAESEPWIAEEDGQAEEDKKITAKDTNRQR